MGRYSVKRYKTKRRTRDLDLIHNDLSSVASIQSLKNQAIDETKAGLGQYFCIHCNKYFQDNAALAAHLKCRPHKRRVKELSVKPYTQLESDAASGTNLNTFIQVTQTYQANEPARLAMESELLSGLVEENKAKEEKLAAQLQAPVESGEIEMSS